MSQSGDNLPMVDHRFSTFRSENSCYTAVAGVRTIQENGRSAMRFMLTVTLPVKTANAAAKAGTLGSTIQAILDEHKPEAAYFTDHEGRRAGFIIVDLPDAASIPRFAEPWMLAFNATIQFRPVMVAEDLAKAGQAIEQAAKKFG
jgi:hypothetical protein